MTQTTKRVRLGHRSAHRISGLVALAVLATAASVGALSSATGAAPMPSNEQAAPIDEVAPNEESVPIDDVTAAMPAMSDDWVTDADESNADQDALAAYLDSVGVDSTVSTDGDYHWVEYDWSDDAASNAVDDFYWSLSPMLQADIDAFNADADAMAAFLSGRGVDVSVTTDRHGLRSAEFDWSDEAASNAVDDFYWSLSPMLQADIDAFNADADAMAAFLSDRGVDVSVTTDRHGLRSAEVDWSDEAAANAVDDFYWSYSPLPVV